MTRSKPAEVATEPVGRPWRLHAIYPQMCEPVGIASIPLELLDAVERNPELRRRFDVHNWVAATRMPRRNQRGLTPRWLSSLAFRIAGGSDWLRRRTARKLIAACRPGDVVLAYPGLLARELEAMRAKGAVIVHEPVNTAHPHGWHALERAYAAAGIPLRRGPDEAAIAEERARIQTGDFALAISPQVLSSHLALGLAPARVLRSSLGWNPERFRPPRVARTGRRFLFVGRGSVRKGLPVLLTAWERAAVGGTLVLVGGIDDEVRQHCARSLARSDVEVLGHLSDLAPIYAAADVFVLPSFEEGSPLVSYQALAAGLPSLLGRAAAGWVVRDGVEGLVVDPDDGDAMVEAMRRLAADRELRERLGAAAAARAAEFTWDRVAAARFSALDQALHRAL